MFLKYHSMLLAEMMPRCFILFFSPKLRAPMPLVWISRGDSKDQDDTTVQIQIIAGFYTPDLQILKHKSNPLLCFSVSFDIIVNKEQFLRGLAGLSKHSGHNKLRILKSGSDFSG